MIRQRKWCLQLLQVAGRDLAFLCVPGTARPIKPSLPTIHRFRHIYGTFGFRIPLPYKLTIKYRKIFRYPQFSEYDWEACTCKTVELHGNIMVLEKYAPLTSRLACKNRPVGIFGWFGTFNVIDPFNAKHQHTQVDPTVPINTRTHQNTSKYLFEHRSLPEHAMMHDDPYF